MQFRLISGFLVFIGSYFPLAIILAAQDIPHTWWDRPICSITTLKAGECSFAPFENPGFSSAFIIITAFSALISYFALKRISYPFNVEIRQFKAIPNEIINYTFPYVVSFMGVSYSEPEKLFGFLVFLIWMFAVTYKSGQIIMNPLLLIFGWRLYEANININGVQRDVRILKKGDLRQGRQCAQTVQDFYVVRD